MNFELAEDSSGAVVAPSSEFVVMRAFGQASGSVTTVEVDFDGDGLGDQTALVDASGVFEAFGIVPASGVSQVSLRPLQRS